MPRDPSHTSGALGPPWLLLFSREWGEPLKSYLIVLPHSSFLHCCVRRSKTGGEANFSLDVKAKLRKRQLDTGMGFSVVFICIFDCYCDEDRKRKVLKPRPLSGDGGKGELLFNDAS